jgi:hypothetical protein
VTHMAVPNVERQWDFGILPDTPASSPYATVPPPDTREKPMQMEPAPHPVNPESQQR